MGYNRSGSKRTARMKRAKKEAERLAKKSAAPAASRGTRQPAKA
jgi:hypothetical protein